MTLSELRSKLKRDHPEVQGFTDAQLNTELNEGQLEIAYLTDCLPTEANFNITADTETYALSTIASDFLKIDREGGLQIKTLVSNTQFDRMTYRSMEELDEMYPGWRDQASSAPHSYFQRGNNIHIFPKFSSAVTNGGRIYFLEKPDTMSSDSSEPFNGASYLTPFHKVIVLYAAMVVLSATKKYQEAAAVETLYADRIQAMKDFIKGHQLDDFTPDVRVGLGARQFIGRRASRF